MKCTCRMHLVFLAVAGTLSVSDAAMHQVASPVERVVNLLKDLKERLVEDEKVESQVYNKYACWCEKTTERKAGAITTAQEELRNLGQSILSLKGRVATLAAEIEERVQAIAANKAAQESATVIRQKENAAFTEETTEMKDALLALQQAIEVLIKATTPTVPALLQSQTHDAIASVLNAIPAHASLSDSAIEHLQSFVQQTSGSKYTPQSLTVQGILTDMYTTFAKDLETSMANEARANKDFEEFIALKQAELEALEAEKKEREEEKAEKESQLADTQEIYDGTQAQKEADVAFFDQTKAACVAKHDDWTTRSSLRSEEISGLSQALEVLTTDSARELFASTIKAGKETGMDDSYNTGRDITAFIQIDSSSPFAQACDMVKKQAKASHSFRLAALAVRISEAKAGHFDAVINSINEMIQVLRDEDTADIAKRDQCKEEYKNIDSKVSDLTWKIENNVAKIHRLDGLIQMRTEQKEQTLVDISNVESDMQAMTAARQAENSAFLKSKSDDQEAIDILMGARTTIMAYYKKNNVEMGPIQGAVKGLALVQGPDFDISADQAPDSIFSDKGNRKDETKGIVQILTTIIEDLDDEIKNSMKSEEESQLEYEGMMAKAQQLKKELVAKKDSLIAAIAERNGEKTAEEQDKTDNEGDLDDQHNYKKSITDDCDFIIRTFEKRAAARVAEMNGLEGAKEFLVGYMPGQAALLESPPTRRRFDDAALSKAKFLGLA